MFVYFSIFFILMFHKFILSIAPSAGDMKSFKIFGSNIKEVIENTIKEWPNMFTVREADPNGNSHHCTTKMAFMSLFHQNLIRLMNTTYSNKDIGKFEELKKLNEALKVCYNSVLKDQILKNHSFTARKGFISLYLQPVSRTYKE